MTPTTTSRLQRPAAKLSRAVLLAIFGGLSVQACPASADGLVLRETLGREWRGERVRFGIAHDQLAEARAGTALVDALTGKATPFEIVNGPRGAEVEFIADLPRLGEARYAFTRGAQPAASDLAIEARDGLIRIGNAQGGIALRTSLSGDEGPVAAIRTTTGAWIGGSRLVTRADNVVDYRIEVTRRGPVAASVTCLTTFASGITWALDVTMIAGDPAILVEERWSAWNHAELHLDLERGFPATHLYFRGGAGASLARVMNQPLKPRDGRIAHVLEPWLRWWMSERQGTWIAAHGEASTDAVVVAALRPDNWIEPADVEAGRRINPIMVTSDGQGLRLELPANGRRRSWLVASVPRDTAIDLSLLGKRAAPPPQRLVLRHSDFPLERVRHVADGGPAGSERRARLMLDEADISRLARLGPLPPPTARSRLAAPLNEFTLGDLIEAYLRSGDVTIGRRLTAEAPRAMQAAVDYFLDQDEQVTLGFAPHHHRNIMYAAHLADFALSDPAFEPALRGRLLAQAAFLGDLVSRPDYWAPQLGFSANPNMTSIVAGYQGLLGCLMQGHPKAQGWLDAALKELHENQLLGWSDENGGWLEAPSYAMLSYDHMLAVALCARNAGRGEHLHHPRMRRIIEWFAKISTPPDSRFHGRRLLPPIGNSYVLETTSQFGNVAQLWRERDPVFAAEMQWMHLASGAPTHTGVGGHAPAMAPYQKVLKNLELPAKRPSYGSELFPQTGAILRNHFGTERETQAHMIAGSNHAHYDYDSGSITLWGKGRVIADDFGYYARAPASDHSMVDSPSAESILRVTSFATTEALDYVAGRSGRWSRQLALIKDRDPLGANYFVLRDELDAAKGGTWRLWLTARSVTIDGNVVSVSGEEDVDTDIILLTRPATPPRLETITRTSAASGHGRRHPTTQTGIIIDLPPGNAAVAAVIHPRLKGEPAVRVETFEDGRVAHVVTGHGADTVFLAREVFAANRNGVAFNGAAGVVLRRGSAHSLALGAAGTIAVGPRNLSTDGAKAVAFAD